MTDRNILSDLKDIRSRRQEIELLRNRLAHLQAAASGSRAPLRHGSAGTAEHDHVGALVAQIEEVQDRLLARIVAAECCILDLEELVDRLPGPQRQVIRLRHFEGYSWKEVAKVTHYSERRCLQVQEEALQALREASAQPMREAMPVAAESGEHRHGVAKDVV